NRLRQFLKPGHIESGIYKSRREIPAGRDAMAVEPIAEHFRAVAAREVVELRRLSLRSLKRGVHQMLPMLGLESLAEAAEKELHFLHGLLQVRSRPARRCRWIVELVRQTRGHGTQGNELLPLLRVAFQISHPACSRAKNLPSDCLASPEHQPEFLFVEPKQSRRLGYAGRRKPRNVQQQHSFTKKASRFLNAQKNVLVIVRSLPE